MNKIGEIKNKNILFLQGPMGPFFKRLDSIFRGHGAKTFKIGFNVSDYIFSHRDNYVPYKDTQENWIEFLTDFLKEKTIHQIYLFGDCRFYQKHAISISQTLGIEVFVFEEGYIRPDYVTLEKYGVNNYSKISRDKEFYEKLDIDELEYSDPKPAYFSQTEMIYSAIVYYTFSNLLHFLYPHYKHHRDFSAMREFFFGGRSLFRRFLYKWSERKYNDIISKDISKKYYFIPLQTHNDFQILEHSGYKSIEKFIIEVLESFSNSAPRDRWLVFKHHPVDRGRKNYENFIMQQARLFGVEKRILVIHDVHLPMCLEHAIGTITINSTVGLSSISYKTPTITLGNALYDIEGLTCKDMPLSKFWHKQIEPDMDLYEKYRRYLINITQLNGSFYGKMPILETE